MTIRSRMVTADHLLAASLPLLEHFPRRFDRAVLRHPSQNCLDWLIVCLVILDKPRHLIAHRCKSKGARTPSPQALALGATPGDIAPIATYAPGIVERLHRSAYSSAMAQCSG